MSRVYLIRIWKICVEQSPPSNRDGYFAYLLSGTHWFGRGSSSAGWIRADGESFVDFGAFVSQSLPEDILLDINKIAAILWHSSQTDAMDRRSDCFGTHVGFYDCSLASSKQHDLKIKYYHTKNCLLLFRICTGLSLIGPWDSFSRELISALCSIHDLHVVIRWGQHLVIHIVILLDTASYTVLRACLLFLVQICQGFIVQELLLAVVHNVLVTV